ncbi:MAG: D-alanine--D-alanine ligase [Deltaproteobacteria bacterium]|nr:D-alanine--D-alanine ligase [Deltaproteobacteria bacterium]
MTETVAILCGGKSGEHEVSLRSAAGIYQAMDRKRFAPLILARQRDGLWRGGTLEEVVEYPEDPAQVRIRPQARQVIPVAGGGGTLTLLEANGKSWQNVDLCFPILHGTGGEDGTLQGYLNILGVPFAGPGVLGSAVGMDKDMAKRLLAQAGLAVARWHTLTSPAQGEGKFKTWCEEWGARVLYVKPARMGSSVGVGRAESEEAFRRALAEAFRFDHKVLVEEAVTGREIECAVLGTPGHPQFPPRASVAGEIVPKDGFYSYQAKYLDADGARLLAPAPLDSQETERVQQAALEVFQVLDCEGMSRVDFFYTPDRRLVVNEINTLPGFTPISMYPKLWELSGVPYGELLTTLLTLARWRWQQDNALEITP